MLDFLSLDNFTTILSLFLENTKEFRSERRYICNQLSNGSTTIYQYMYIRMIKANIVKC